MIFLTVGSTLFLDFSYRLMNLLYSIIFSPPSTFCVLNLFENRSSPNTLLIEENTISAIHLLPASFICFHFWYPSFLSSSTSSLLNWHPLVLVDAFRLVQINALDATICTIKADNPSRPTRFIYSIRVWNRRYLWKW